MLNQAVINLKTLLDNVNEIKSRLNHGVKFCAVVKADAYGHGACEVAKAIYKEVDCFAVALLEEGIRLRQSGIDKDILVLCPIYPQDAEGLVRYNLTATVCDIEGLLFLEHEGEKQKNKVSVHLKYNTGMNRQGVDDLGELSALLECGNACKWVSIDGLYSHLARPEHKNHLFYAENKFLLANNLIKRYNKRAICHLSASGGFLCGAQWDMVRIGILLYGYKPFPSKLISVKPVMKIYSPVIAKRSLARGESALYGYCPSRRKIEINLVRYGYADGLERRRVKGQFNNRCMDLTALDSRVQSYSNEYSLDGENVKIAVLSDADKLAKEYGTISYEILVKASIRAEKIYIR